MSGQGSTFSSRLSYVYARLRVDDKEEGVLGGQARGQSNERRGVCRCLICIRLIINYHTVSSDTNTDWPTDMRQAGRG